MLAMVHWAVELGQGYTILFRWHQNTFPNGCNNLLSNKKKIRFLLLFGRLSSKIHQIVKYPQAFETRLWHRKQTNK